MNFYVLKSVEIYIFTSLKMYLDGCEEESLEEWADNAYICHQSESTNNR